LPPFLPSRKLVFPLPSCYLPPFSRLYPVNHGWIRAPPFFNRSQRKIAGDGFLMGFLLFLIVAPTYHPSPVTNQYRPLRPTPPNKHSLEKSPQISSRSAHSSLSKRGNPLLNSVRSPSHALSLPSEVMFHKFLPSVGFFLPITE